MIRILSLQSIIRPFHHSRTLVSLRHPPFLSPIIRPSFSANIIRMSSTAAGGNLATIDLSNYDPEQSRLMDERCIVVDENDHVLGAEDKKTCSYIYLFYHAV